MDAMLNTLAVENGSLWAMDAHLARGYLAAKPEEMAARRVPRAQGRIAIIPMWGVLTQKQKWYSTGTESVLRMIQAAVATPDIGAVVLDIDSPGGSVYGMQEFGSAIYAMREAKPIIALANPLAASAAYWAGTAADRFFATPSGDVGSVGVYAMHVDASKALEKMGLSVTFVHAGRYKVEGNPAEPLSEEARANIQEGVDAAYAEFTGAVAKYRGVSRSHVLSEFGEGRVVDARKAKAAGMVDGSATMDNLLQMIMRKTGGGKNASRELTQHLAAAGGIDLQAVSSVEAIRLRRERERSRR